MAEGTRIARIEEMCNTLDSQTSQMQTSLQTMNNMLRQLLQQNSTVSEEQQDVAQQTNSSSFSKKQAGDLKTEVKKQVNTFRPASKWLVRDIESELDGIERHQDQQQIQQAAANTAIHVLLPVMNFTMQLACVVELKVGEAYDHRESPFAMTRGLFSNSSGLGRHLEPLPISSPISKVIRSPPSAHRSTLSVTSTPPLSPMETSQHRTKTNRKPSFERLQEIHHFWNQELQRHIASLIMRFLNLEDDESDEDHGPQREEREEAVLEMEKKTND